MGRMLNDAFDSDCYGFILLDIEGSMYICILGLTVLGLWIDQKHFILFTVVSFNISSRTIRYSMVLELV